MGNWSGANMRCPQCNKYMPDRCTCNGPSIEERRAMGTEMNVEAERAAFEAWTRKDIGMPDSVPFNWDTDWVKAAFEGWLERARRAAQPADVGAGELPKLPQPLRFAQWTGGEEFAYTADQMRQYARDAIAAERRARTAVEKRPEKGEESVETRMDAGFDGAGTFRATDEPVYQVKIDAAGHWCDINASDINNWKSAMFEVRTLYAAPPLSSEPQLANLDNRGDELANSASQVSTPLSSEQQAEKGEGACGS